MCKTMISYARLLLHQPDALAAGTMSIKSALKSIAKFMLETKRKVGETVELVFRRRQQEKRNDEEKEVADDAKEDVLATEQKQVMDLPVQDSAVDLQDEEWSVVSGKKGAPEQDAAEDSAKDDEEEYAEDSDEYMAKVLGAHKKTSMDERIDAMDKLAPLSPLTPTSHRITVYDPTTCMVKLEAGF